jgi:hypothetical protein
VKPADRETLTALFRQLGARDPEGWAQSQVTEGIPQLGRFLFLRAAWSKIVSESDESWIDAEIANAQARPNEPYAGVGQALKSLVARGATKAEVTDLVRGMQARLLFQLCYLLEAPESAEDAVADVQWGLFLVNDDGQPEESLQGLHESVLGTDPTGREMRPRGKAD